ncbi:MAG: serine/threonine-protein kinase [Verrucomicrobiota bacterium]
MSNTCQICGQPLSAEAVDGFCVACLFGKGAAARCRPAFTPPAPRLERLGDHELLGELGRGAMGRVYRARQVRPDRVVALKVISAWAIGFANHLERFRVEAQAAAKLGHPNIVPIYEVGEEAEWHYFSMRLIEGGSLSCALTKGRLPFEKTARLLATVARAIQHAHERGVLHRDIKPGNILLDASGEPHVADFGLAKITESDSNLTLTRTALGTPAYMAPEQAAGRGKEITTAVDVYGLGAVLFEMLTARAPFVGDSPMAVARQVVEEEAPAPISLDSTIPVELSVICSKCLEKAPSRRYSSAGTLADDLERWLRHEPILAQSTTALGRLGKWARRKPVHAALVGTVALGLSRLSLPVSSGTTAASQSRSTPRNSPIANWRASCGAWNGARRRTPSRMAAPPTLSPFSPVLCEKLPTI